VSVLPREIAEIVAWIDTAAAGVILFVSFAECAVTQMAAAALRRHPVKLARIVFLERAPDFFAMNQLTLSLLVLKEPA
jgi:hypothetical protein